MDASQDLMGESQACPSTLLGDTPAPLQPKVLRCSVRDEDAPKAGPGEVTPLMPLEENRDGKDIIVQGGWYGSLFVRALTGNVTPGQLKEFLKECEDKKSGAVYAAFPQSLMANDANGRLWLGAVLLLGYKHHHLHKETGEHIYYKWTKDTTDMVPEYATSVEGGGVLVVSPDEKEVLLVRNVGWTDAHWARPGGATLAGESCLQAALRECKEETEAEIDDNFPSQLVASYNKPKARDERINDHFQLFAVKAKTKNIKIDQKEIGAAGWHNIEDLVAGWNAALSALGEGEPIPRSIQIGGAKFGSMELVGLDRFQKGDGAQQRMIGGMEIY